MSTVWVPRRERADAESTPKFRFDPYVTVLDLDPSRRLGDIRQLSDAQCQACSFVSFLKTVPEVRAHDGLALLSSLFDVLPDVSYALERKQSDHLRQIAALVGARRVYEIVLAGLAPTLELPRIHVLGADDGALRLGPEDWVLAQPDGRGPKFLCERLSVLRRRGVTRVVIGYLEHARATESYSEFIESAGDSGALEATWAALAALGFERLGFALALSPCASLQWPRNRPLEARRARLDLVFNRLDSDAPRMCPENVSGYGLLNDSQVLRDVLPDDAARAVRVDRLLFVG